MQAIVREAQALDGLTEHGGWRILFNRVRAQRDGFLLSIARRLMSGELVDQREIDFNRGYYEGALNTLARPDKALENLEKAARHAWTLAQLELIAEEEEASPYA